MCVMRLPKPGVCVCFNNKPYSIQSKQKFWACIMRFGRGTAQEKEHSPSQSDLGPSWTRGCSALEPNPTDAEESTTDLSAPPYSGPWDLVFYGGVGELRGRTFMWQEKLPRSPRCRWALRKVLRGTHCPPQRAPPQPRCLLIAKTSSSSDSRFHSSI